VLVSSIYLFQCFLNIHEVCADPRARNRTYAEALARGGGDVAHIASKNCKKKDKTCYFELEIAKKMTMYDPVSGTRLYAKDGKLVTLNGDVFTGDSSNVMSTDGYMKLLTVANGQFPGPSIEVWEGQTVEIKVINSIASEVTTIHWHGVHQRETPWMDGVGRLTQCSIIPGDSFTYKFKAEPSGTMWYHSHVGAQRVDGLYGNFIIREKSHDPSQEHTLMINNYNHQNNGDEQWQMTNTHIAYPDLTTGSFAGYGMGGATGNSAGGNGAAPDGFKQGGSSQAPDGSGYSPMTYHSTLINGKGRFWEAPVGPNAPSAGYNGAPLSVFKVKKSKTYRFRLINGGSLYPFQFSIEDHMMKVVASDGAELQPVEVESVIVSPGERFDVTVKVDKPKANYWIRAHSMVADGSMPGEHRDGFAILHYDGAPTDVDPTTEPEDDRSHCTTEVPCKVAACPFPIFPASYNSVCLNFGTDLKRRFVASDGPPAPKYPKKGKNFKTYFLNFHLVSGASVNGRRFGLLPPYNVMGIESERDFLRTCSSDDDPNCGNAKVCRCPLSIFPEPGEVMELVIMNIGDGAKQNHPIHIHGHYWHVLKAGQLEFDDEGKPINPRAGHPDMECKGGNTANGFPYCNKVKYKNKSWKGDDIPGLDLDNAPLKDTLNIPQGGYFITRIVADNPGLWFMHCHIEVHVESGMAMVIAEPQNLPLLEYPPELQVCGSESKEGGKQSPSQFCQYFVTKGTCNSNSAKNCEWKSGNCNHVDCSKYNKKKKDCDKAVVSCKYDTKKSKCKNI